MEYLGIYQVPEVGPAKRGMPLIPTNPEDGKIVRYLSAHIVVDGACNRWSPPDHPEP